MIIVTMRKITAAILACTLIFALAGCKSQTAEKPSFTAPGANGSRTDDELGFQFDPPQKGEEIAVLNTSKGVIKIRLFEQSAPIAVANFKAQIKAGYYNGLTFHRVIKDFVVQGGDDGKGSKSIWGGSFESEINRNLLHFRGSVASAKGSAADSNGSQFYIVQGAEQLTEKDLRDVEGLTDAEKAMYIEHGGSYHLDQNVNPSTDYNVFGQVFEGMEVVDAIASVLTNSSDKPLDDVTIDSASVEVY